VPAVRASLFLTVLAACGSSTGAARSAGSGYCPSIAGAWPWRAELFAGCPIPPFVIDLPVCDGPCPRPCAASGDSGTTPWSATYGYDDAGHWTGLAFAGASRDQCTWRDGRLDHCAIGEGPPLVAIRDGDGRLTSIDDGLALPVSWSERGQVVAVGDRTFTYDAGGRLATVHDEARDDTTQIRYDGSGRIAGTRDRRFVSTWHHDGAGRLVRVDRDPHGHTDGALRQRTELRYDAQHRLASLDQRGPDASDTYTATYRYDCP